MPVGEASKRRQQRGASWGQTVGISTTVASNTVAVSVAVPPEATHMRVYNDSASIFTRFGWNVAPTAAIGVILGLRFPEVFLIPPEATTVQFILTTVGTTGVNTYFYSRGSDS